jgi:RNA polymerase sigma-70 factor (ECF subfamily)
MSQKDNSSVIQDTGDHNAYKELILLAKRGDKDAFAKVYESLYVPLYRYVVSKCRDEELAQDISQQAFLRFYESLDSYIPSKTPLAYLFTVAKRLLINEGERKTFEPFDELFLETYNDEAPSLLDEAHVRALAQSITSFLPSLSHDEQEVVRLYFFAELSYKEISDTLDKEEASIRKIKERALKKLRVLTDHLHETH